ncbi:methyltransferase [Bradyrhizobium sp. C9]|nr:methyltransferase [Bradyrhizobium sp. C9]
MEPARFIWRALRSRFRDHRGELSAIRRHIRPGDVVCDIGANKGSFLYWLSRWCQHGRVVAFEPQADLAEYLVMMCRNLQLNNTTIEHSAVFSKTGEQQLFIPLDHKPGASLIQTPHDGDTGIVSVPTVSLDDYFSDDTRVAVLKVDVEGAEKHVFDGARRILERDMPLLVFECESRHIDGNMSDVFSYLEDLGYRGSFVQQGQTRPLSFFNEDIHQKRDGDYFWKKRGYCSNFIFVRDIK